MNKDQRKRIERKTERREGVRRVKERWRSAREAVLHERSRVPTSRGAEGRFRLWTPASGAHASDIR